MTYSQIIENRETDRDADVDEPISPKQYLDIIIAGLQAGTIELLSDNTDIDITDQIADFVSTVTVSQVMFRDPNGRAADGRSIRLDLRDVEPTDSLGYDNADTAEQWLCEHAARVIRPRVDTDETLTLSIYEVF